MNNSTNTTDSTTNAMDNTTVVMNTTTIHVSDEPPRQEYAEPESGYDIGVFGLDNGLFYWIHIPAMVCIVASFTCALTAIILSFRQRSYRTYFRWSKSQRFIVYLAVCDGLFNVSHMADHLHIIIAKDNVYPKELCAAYGFILSVFISAQNLMVNVAAINAFMLMYFERNIKFGQNDWKLLLWTFGVPFLGAIAAALTDQFGPTGAYCYFDDIKGKVGKIFFTTVTLLLILFVNSILYVLTWTRLYKQTHAFKKALGTTPASMKASIRAARSMSLFVAAFIIQYCPMTLYGAWSLIDVNIPQPLVHIVTIFTNLGGVLNLGVFLLIRTKRRRSDVTGGTPGSRETTLTTSSSDANSPPTDKTNGKRTAQYNVN